MGQENLKQLMEKNHGALLKAWFEQVIGAYSDEAHKYFAKVDNEFSNPVGSNIYRALDQLLAELHGEADADALYRHLEMIMRIRAVQDMKPSRAVAFMFAFKAILRKQFADEIAAGKVTEADLRDMDGNLDTLGLMAFDLYMESKNLIYELRIKQIKETNDMLQKANLLNESLDASSFMRCSNYIEE